ncbi:membrane-spanning 4-domains subfamily A member 18 [Tenrec ecaudatus]|uniref:membrane-spanning 4-domains subfamily A member 18 n=1 Tax=Tenrec ecaudatus TaxID=94439 RepID=UPI003F59F882
MTTLKMGTDGVPGVIAPIDVHATKPRYPVAAGSPGQTPGVIAHAASTSMVQGDAGRVHLQSSPVVLQNPAGVAVAQSLPIILQYPAEQACLQTAPTVIQDASRTTNVQTLPQAPQNPPNFIPPPTGASNPFQWNMSFGSFSTFDPKEFINEEVRTLGAIQILIGLMHIFWGINPLLYPKGQETWVTGPSGYLFWGGLSFIISGSLSVHAAKDPSPCMVNGSVGMNIVSAIFSLCGIFILITEMALTPMVSFQSAWIYLVVYSGSLLPFALLEFCLTCVVSHFGCQATCWNRSTNMTSISTLFKANPISTVNGPYNATHSPVNPTASLGNTTTNYVNVATSPVNTAVGVVHATTDAATHAYPNTAPQEVPSSVP